MCVHQIGRKWNLRRKKGGREGGKKGGEREGRVTVLDTHGQGSGGHIYLYV